MMGRVVNDPAGLEGPPGSTQGLGLLPIATDLAAPKTTTLTRFSWGDDDGIGYEIHMGQTRRLDGRALLTIQNRNGRTIQAEDGCVSQNDRCLGTYMHGLFDTRTITARWLSGIGLRHCRLPQNFGWSYKDKAYELLVEHLQAHVDMDAIANLVLEPV